MRAAEDKCIDPFAHKRLKITRDDLVGQIVFEPAFFDERNEQWASARGDVDLGIEFAQRFLIRAAFNRCARSDYANMPIACRGDSCLRARLDHANDWNGQSFL